jgi:hypothetical protein
MKPVFFCIISILSIALASLVWGQSLLDAIIADDKNIGGLLKNDPSLQRKPQSDDSSAKYRSPSLSDSGVVTNEKYMGSLSDLLKRSSTLEIDYSQSSGMKIKITGNETGAVVIFRQSTISLINLVVEIDRKEWHRLISALYNVGIGKWKRGGYPFFKGNRGKVQWWQLRIDDRQDQGPSLFISSGAGNQPFNWERFKEVIDNFAESIVHKHKMIPSVEYEKRFGVPMTKIQRSIDMVSLYDGRGTIWVKLHQTNDVFARFSIRGSSFMDLGTQVYMEDWLDVVRALDYISFECCDKPEWKECCYKQGDTSKITYPPAWDTLSEIMSGIKTTIKKNTCIEALEIALEEEYMKKYGVQISEFERSLMRVSFRDSTKSVVVNRSISGAAMTNDTSCANRFSGGGSTGEIIIFDIEEWMDFIRALYKIHIGAVAKASGGASPLQIYGKNATFVGACPRFATAPIDRWSKFRKENYRRHEVTVFFSDTDTILQISGCDRYISERPVSISADDYRHGLKWTVGFGLSDGQLLWYNDNETYPPNWKEFRKLITDWEAKFLKGHDK